MRVLIIDNYDSFTYNLYQCVGELLQSRVPSGTRQGKYKDFILGVFRNDKISLSEIKKRAYDRIIISPGPGDPSNKAYFGVCAEVITDVGKKTPVLGVCLGMQGMAHYFGGKVVRAKLPMHGKTSIIVHDGKGVFKNLPQGLEVMRYHSLVADLQSLPHCLEVSCVTPYGETLGKALKNRKEVEIMGLRHKEYPIEGIQFHPESFATEGGKEILKNFLFR
jgi:anthranilate synthase component 2